MKKNNQIPILLGFLGVLFAIGVFFVVYRPYIEKTEELEANNQMLLQSLNKYKEIAENEVFYKESTEQMNAETRDIITAYANGMIREDQIMYMANLDKRFSEGLHINFFNMGEDSEIVYGTIEETLEAPTEIPEDTTEASTVNFTEPLVVDNGIHMFQNTIETGYEVSYEGLKDVLDYINGLGYKKNLSDISLTFDSTSGLLAGSMGINQYFLTGTEGIYSPSSILDTRLGVENIFGTVDINLDDETSEE